MRYSKTSIHLLFCTIIILVLISNTLAALNLSNNPDFIEDSLGRKIQIKPYLRIGVLNPAIVKTMQMIGFDSAKIAGVDSYSYKHYATYLHPDTILIGDFNKPNIEKIILADIDILFIDKSFHYSSYKDLEIMKIPYYVYTSSPSSYDTIKTSLRNLCKILGREQSFMQLNESLILPYEKKIKTISSDFKEKSICIIVWADTKYTCAGKDSFLGILFSQFGFKNAISDNGWPIIGIEKLLTLNPDFILIATHFSDKNIFSNSIFSSLSAIKNNNVAFFDESMENRMLQLSFDLWEGFYTILLHYKIKP